MHLCVCAHVLSECARWHFAAHEDEHPTDAPAGHMSFPSTCVHTAGLHQIRAYSKRPYSFFLMHFTKFSFILSSFIEL